MSQEVIEAAARQMVRYERWHEEKLDEAKELEGREKYSTRGKSGHSRRFPEPTAEDVLDEAIPDYHADYERWHKMMEAAGKLAKDEEFRASC